jgi:hypothetical protein
MQTENTVVKHRIPSQAHKIPVSAINALYRLCPDFSETEKEIEYYKNPNHKNDHNSPKRTPIRTMSSALEAQEAQVHIPSATRLPFDQYTQNRDGSMKPHKGLGVINSNLDKKKI